jgi:hypothetical protein
VRDAPIQAAVIAEIALAIQILLVRSCFRWHARGINWGKNLTSAMNRIVTSLNFRSASLAVLVDADGGIELGKEALPTLSR